MDAEPGERGASARDVCLSRRRQASRRRGGQPGEGGVERADPVGHAGAARLANWI